MRQRKRGDHIIHWCHLLEKHCKKYRRWKVLETELHRAYTYFSKIWGERMEYPTECLSMKEEQIGRLWKNWKWRYDITSHIKGANGLGFLCTLRCVRSGGIQNERQKWLKSRRKYSRMIGDRRKSEMKVKVSSAKCKTCKKHLYNIIIKSARKHCVNF